MDRGVRYDIITVGSAVVDAFLHTEKAELHKIHQQLDLCYPLGAKVLVKELEFFTGGGGTNTAVSFSRLGFKTAYLGMIGLDNNGKMILDELHKEKVDFIGGRGKISGFSVIIDAVAKDRTVFAYKGCVDEFSRKHFQLTDLECDWFYFSAMMNRSMKTQEFLAKYAHKKNIKIAYNPSLYLAKKGHKFLKNILKYTEVLILNKEEIKELLKTDSNNLFELSHEASNLGPNIVVVTDGEHGVQCFNKHEACFYAARPKKVHIVETTGAGDAFSSGFVTGLMRGKSIDVALKIGMLNAESVIAHKGAKNILLDNKAFIFAEKDKRVILKRPL